MKITVEQAEIETAIKQFVKSQLVISADQDISIDLKATRGDQGFTADVNISLVKPTAEPTVAPVAKATVAKAVVIKRPEPEVTQEVQEEVTVEQPVETPDEAQTAAVDEAQPVETTAEVVEETQPAPRSSLFSGLKRPENN